MKVKSGLQIYDILIIDSALVEGKFHYPQKIFKILREKQKKWRVGILHFYSIEANYKQKKNTSNTSLLKKDYFDVCTFNTFNLSSILKKLSPKIVIMFTHSFLIDRAIIKACRKRGIISVFFQHGSQTQKLQRKKVTIQNIVDKIRRYSKYGLYYFITDFSTVFKFSTWKFIFKAPFLNVSQIPDNPLEETHCDYAFVWGEWYRDLFVRLNGYSRDHVFIIGYPDLDHIFIKNNKKLKKILNNNIREMPLSKAKILYITQPLEKDRLVSEKEYKRFIQKIISIANKLDIILYLGIHPRDNFKWELYKQNNIKIIRNSARLIPHLDLIIGHHSSLLGAALTIGKPIIIMDTFSRWKVPFIPGITNLAYRICRSIEHLETSIHEAINKFDLTQTQELSKEAQKYFALNSEGTYVSFRNILLELVRDKEQ